MMKDIPGYEGKYQINESGIVINNRGHVMRTAQSNSGYLRTALEIPGKPGERVNESIHRLVAETFLDNPDNLPVVMHKDNDPLNNHVSNLKYGTQSENIQQAFDENRKFSPASNKRYIYEVYSESDNKVYRCIGRAAVAELIQYEIISLKNMIGNKRKIALGPYKGYMIRRTDEFINIDDYTSKECIDLFNIDSISTDDVQRLSLNEGVKPQAYGGGKIQPFNIDYFINKYRPNAIHMEPYTPKKV